MTRRTSFNRGPSRASRKNSLQMPAGYGFIPAVKTGGGVKFLLTKGRLWQIVVDRAVNRKRMQVFYTGKVQGVGFRYTVKTVSTGFDVTGTVRNLSDGRVELVAEGKREELEEFRGAIRDSGLGHFVQNEAVKWGDAQNEFRGFEIVR
jgi:acylphosphatase